MTDEEREYVEYLELTNRRLQRELEQRGSGRESDYLTTAEAMAMLRYRSRAAFLCAARQAGVPCAVRGAFRDGQEPSTHGLLWKAQNVKALLLHVARREPRIRPRKTVAVVDDTPR